MIASTPAPVPAPETDRVVVLTPRGEAARQLYQLVRIVRELTDADRRAMLALLAVELPQPAA